MYIVQYMREVGKNFGTGIWKLSGIMGVVL